MELILLRHPPVQAANRCYGRLDLPVAPEALQHAVAQLQQWRGAVVYSSPAQRCLQLAQQLAPAPIIWPELQELDFGAWEGKCWDEIERAELDAWAADIWHYRPGGGENAADLRQRWQSVCRRLQDSGLAQAVVVSHAGLIRMALADSGLIDEAQRWQATIAYNHPYRLEL